MKNVSSQMNNDGEVVEVNHSTDQKIIHFCAFDKTRECNNSCVVHKGNHNVQINKTQKTAYRTKCSRGNFYIENLTPNGN